MLVRPILGLDSWLVSMVKGFWVSAPAYRKDAVAVVRATISWSATRRSESRTCAAPFAPSAEERRIDVSSVSSRSVVSETLSR